MRSTERFVDRNGRQTGAREDAFLSVQRKVITMFRNKHVCQQAGGRNALVNDMRGHQGLGQQRMADTLLRVTEISPARDITVPANR